MKKVLSLYVAIIIMIASCKTTGNLTRISPKNGTIEIPANGELRIWNNISHSSFSVELTNDNEKQSCELYKVSSNGNEKWISP